MPLPDFLVIGAMKCGTSTLAAQLAAQPGIYMTRPKEPNFFSDDAIYERGLQWYESLFDGASPGDLKGEASTHYTKLPTYPETLPRMHRVLSAPRLVYVIRDPIDRAVSHYIHEWTEGRISTDPATAFAEHPELIAYSRYAMQIEPFVDTYGPKAICLASLEAIKADPNREFARIGAHIGMASPAIWQVDIGIRNASADRIRKLPLHRVLVANPVAKTLRRALVPKSVRTRIRSNRTHGPRPKLPEQLRAKLADIFAEDRSRLLEMDLPGTEDVLPKCQQP